MSAGVTSAQSAFGSKMPYIPGTSSSIDVTTHRSSAWPSAQRGRTSVLPAARVSFSSSEVSISWTVPAKANTVPAARYSSSARTQRQMASELSAL